MIRNVGPGFTLMLQFKSPWVTPRGNDDLYKFSVNEQQHEALEGVASDHPNAVLYVFRCTAHGLKQKTMRPICAKTLGFSLCRPSRWLN